MQRMMNQNRDASRCSAALSEPSRCANTANAAGLSTSNLRGDFPPKLTNKEKTLLWDNEGCFRCRKFYVDHKSKECKTDFPLGKNYKELVQADADTAKAKKSHNDKD